MIVVVIFYELTKSGQCPPLLIINVESSREYKTVKAQYYVYVICMNLY